MTMQDHPVKSAMEVLTPGLLSDDYKSGTAKAQNKSSTVKPKANISSLFVYITRLVSFYSKFLPLTLLAYIWTNRRRRAGEFVKNK
jgi:hypothetical protein